SRCGRRATKAVLCEAAEIAPCWSEASNWRTRSAAGSSARRERTPRLAYWTSWISVLTPPLAAHSLRLGRGYCRLVAADVSSGRNRVMTPASEAGARRCPDTGSRDGPEERDGFALAFPLGSVRQVHGGDPWRLQRVKPG